MKIVNLPPARNIVYVQILYIYINKYKHYVLLPEVLATPLKMNVEIETENNDKKLFARRVPT